MPLSRVEGCTTYGATGVRVDAAVVARMLLLGWVMLAGGRGGG